MYRMDDTFWNLVSLIGLNIGAITYCPLSQCRRDDSTLSTAFDVSIQDLNLYTKLDEKRPSNFGQDAVLTRYHNNIIFLKILLCEPFKLGVRIVIHEHFQLTTCVFLGNRENGINSENLWNEP